MSLKWVDLNGIKDAIADVRNDKTSTNWVLLKYGDGNSNDVSLYARGDNGINELIPHLNDNILSFFIYLFFFATFMLFVLFNT